MSLESPTSAQRVDRVAKRSALFDPDFVQRLPQLALIARLARQGQRPGERHSRLRGAGLEFADHRDYAPGDDYRHIDWHAYARVGRLVLRLYEQTADTDIQVLIDCSASMGLGQPSKLHYTAQLTAALAYIALRQLDRVSIVGFGCELGAEVTGARGRGSLLPMLDFLTDLVAAGPTDLGAAMRQFVATRRRRGIAILISDLLDRAGAERGIDQLRHAHLETYVLQLHDPRELTALDDGEFELCDAETNEVRRVRVTAQLRERYLAAQALARARLASYCHQKHVALFSLDTSVRPEDALLRMLRRGGMLR